MSQQKFIPHERDDQSRYKETSLEMAQAHRLLHHCRQAMKVNSNIYDREYHCNWMNSTKQRLAIAVYIFQGRLRVEVQILLIISVVAMSS